MAVDDPRERAEQRTLLMPRREQRDELAVGQRLQEFVIERVLGTGAYSVVYLAQDTKLERRVALKEYLPSTLSCRAPDGQVVPRLPRFAELQVQGLQSFMAEARLLGGLDHPALLKVFRVWPENGTAYMAMPYYEGLTLQRWLTQLGAPPSERWLRQLVVPLMDALAVMHARQCLHRDVAPDNILLLHDRAPATAAGGAGSYLEQRPRPVLLDFGAARRVIGDATQSLTAILKSGYSPVEQYEGPGPAAAPRQGPWTDVYALCAVLYTAIAGRAPPSAVARAVKDECLPAGEAGLGRYSAAFLAAIDAGLALQPERRPQDMAALRALLNAEQPPAATTTPLAPPPATPAPSPRPAQAATGHAASPGFWARLFARWRR